MIKCISCKFAKIEEGASNSKWDAYECSNPKSEYHRALLNVRPNGEMLKEYHGQAALMVKGKRNALPKMMVC